MPGSDSGDLRLSFAESVDSPVGDPDGPEHGPVTPRHRAVEGRDVEERFLGDVVPRSAAFGRGASAAEVPEQHDGSLEPDEWGEPAEAGSIVRPYSWTRGRTRPVQDLAIETLVSLSRIGPAAAGGLPEHHAIVELCERPQSVAEVAALLSIPLGVARVLLADMVDTGCLQVHASAVATGELPDLDLLTRVRDGLYRL